MKMDKDHIDKFKKEMGFKSCDFLEVDFSEEELINKKITKKIEGDCTNSYEDTIKCTAYMDINTNELKKSHCEKKE